jgi:hypothetical protein
MLICMLVYRAALHRLYTGFAYRVMRGAITGPQIESSTSNFY